MNDMSDWKENSGNGRFHLTGAIKPTREDDISLQESFRIETYEDADSRDRIPMLTAAVSREQLFDAFLSILDQLGETVDVVVESRHEITDQSQMPRDFLREQLDMAVFKSYCIEFEKEIVEDGCLSIAVMDPRGPCEVQLDDHKLIVIFAKNLNPFIHLLEGFGLDQDNGMQLVSEVEHIHYTSAELSDRLEVFCMSINAEESWSGQSSLQG